VRKRTKLTWNTTVSQENSLPRTPQHSQTCHPVVAKKSHRFWRQNHRFWSHCSSHGILSFAVFSRKGGFTGCGKDKIWSIRFVGEFLPVTFLDLSTSPSCRVWVPVITVDEHPLVINQSRMILQQCSP